MKKLILNGMLGLMVCFFSACGDNTNYSTTTEEVGSGEGDELATADADDENVGMENTTDSTKIVTGNPATPAYTTDPDFVAMAASGGMLEVDLGKLAAQKGANSEVKQFGQHMVEDHTNANNELKALANKKGWAVPAYMSAPHKEIYDRISQLSGNEFDREYMKQMVADHEKTVALFDQASQKAEDADLKAFAGKTLPALRQHLDMARERNNKLQNM